MNDEHGNALGPEEAFNYLRNQAIQINGQLANVQAGIAAQVQAAVADLPAAGQAAGAAGGQQRPAQQRIKAFANEAEDNWPVWRRQFLTTVRLNGYNDLQQRLALVGAMTGKAALAANDIDVEAVIDNVQPTIGTVLDRYQARFLPEAASQLARIKFDGTRQGNTETCLTYHSRLRALFNEAYPGEENELTLIRKFIQGLRRTDLKMQVMRCNPITYQQALEAAQNEASVRQLGKLYELGAAPIGDEPMEIGAMQERSRYVRTNNAGENTNTANGKRGTCHFCHKKGHWKRECIAFKNSKRPGQSAAQGQGRANRVRNLIAALGGALEEEAQYGREDAPAHHQAGADASEGEDF